MLTSVKHAFRVLRKDPGFTAVAICSMAIGIGATAAMFSFADSMLLRPLPIAEPGRVVAINTSTPAAFSNGAISYPDYVDLRDHNRTFDGLLAGGLENPKGWRDLLSGAAEFGEVIHRDAGSRLHIIPAGVDDGEPRYDIAMTVEALARTYDFVVFTTTDAANTLRFAPMFDTILLRDADPAAGRLFDALSRFHADVSLIEDALEELVAA